MPCSALCNVLVTEDEISIDPRVSRARDCPPCSKLELKWERPAGISKVMGHEMSTPTL